jgi:hypothetical protein
MYFASFTVGMTARARHRFSYGYSYSKINKVKKLVGVNRRSKRIGSQGVEFWAMGREIHVPAGGMICLFGNSYEIQPQKHKFEQSYRSGSK